MMQLIDIGNTHTRIAECMDGEIISIKRVATSELVESHLLPGCEVAAASVVPAATARLAGHDIFWVAPDIRCNLDLSGVDVGTLGSDRLANAIRLANCYPLPALCIDFGTAITFELVDGRRRFCGGAIAPGRAMLRRSLNIDTARLPLLPLDGLPPPTTAGTNTADCIRLGVDCGVLGTVREIIETLQNQIAPEQLTLVGVGGDAGFFIEHLPEITYGGEYFTLYGIYNAWEMNRS